MIVHVDTSAPTPVYEQLRSQIARMVVVGTLPEGAKLPTIRQLATDLGLAKGTVSKAYEGLLRDGLVEAAGRRGTVVRPRPQDAPAAGGERQVAELAARELAVTVRQLGLDRAAAHAALDAALDAVDDAGGREGPDG